MKKSKVFILLSTCFLSFGLILTSCETFTIDGGNTDGGNGNDRTGYSTSWGYISGVTSHRGQFDYLVNTFLTESQWNIIRPHIIQEASDSNMSWTQVTNWMGQNNLTYNNNIEVLRSRVARDGSSTFFYLNPQNFYRWLRVVRNYN